MKTLIISAFPGCGKTTLFNNNKELKILDSDSSKFDKTYFPDNYITHIKENINKVDIILVSSHKIVRDALVQNNIDFILVYPNINIKYEYINRYIKRGNVSSFVNLLENNWNTWINECENQIGCTKIELNKNEYLTDVLNNIL